MNLLEFSSFFREAAPYIHQYRGKTFVVGLSGVSFISDGFKGIAQDIALLSSLGVQIVLVYGARHQIEEALRNSQLPNIINDSDQVTDKNSLEEIKKIFGALRFDIEAALSMGLPNTSMAGAGVRTISGNFITARPYGVLDGVDMLYSGKVRKIDGESITQYLKNGSIVIISPIGYSLSGETFNLKMEEVASKVAMQLNAEKLLYLVKDKGVLNETGQLFSTLSTGDAEALFNSGKIKGDGQSVLPFAIEAVNLGVTRAHVLCATEDGVILNEVFTRLGTGTSIAREAFVKIREATLADIPAIMSIIHPLEEKGILLKRSRKTIENNVQNFAVLENDTLIYACVSLEIYDDAPEMAELSCLAVAPYAQTEGSGQLMVEYIEEKARSIGVKRLFILTTQTAHWFVERGFEEKTLEELPETKQKRYNHERRSKILIKELY